MEATSTRSFRAPTSSAVASVSIVVPVYRGEQSLEELVAEIDAAFAATALPFEVILVDDGSPDRSWSVVERLSSMYPWVTGIQLMRNFGQHNALLAGVRAARHDVVVTMDDDLQHPPSQIPRLLDALGDDVDLVYGFPEREEHGPLRSVASRVVKLALATTLRSPEARHVSAFRAFRSSLRDAFDRNSDPGLTLDVLLAWSTTRVLAVPVRMEPRRYGTSNYTFRRLIRHAVNMITGYSTIPLRVVTLVGMGLTIFGWAVLAYVLVHYALVGGKVPGFTFLAALIAIFSGAQMFALGILGEYLGRIHLRSMKQPQYVIRRRTTDQLCLPAVADQQSGLSAVKAQADTDGVSQYG